MVPVGAKCPQHVEAIATGVCPRCGAFFCDQCARRVRPDSTPMCPACWGLRAQKVEAPKINKHGFQNAGLALGILSLIPLPQMIVVQFASLIVCGIGIGKAEPGVRWRPVVGLICTIIGIIGMIAVVSKM